MRVGIFGGTFDPIHYGHLVIAQTAFNEIPLDKVLFVPAAIPPHKENQMISPAAIRCRLVELTIADNDAFALSKIEIERVGPSFMVDTLMQLRDDPRYATAQFYLLIGVDNLIQFHTWRRYADILQLATLAVYPRYNADITRVAGALLEKSIIFQAPRMEISSSYIRRLVKNKMSIRYLVPPRVEEYIYSQGLYK